MQRWRNLSQVKQPEKMMTRGLIETDISNMPHGEFKAIIMRILAGLVKRMEDFREALTTEIKELKINQSETKTALMVIQNRLNVMNTRVKEAEE